MGKNNFFTKIKNWVNDQLGYEPKMLNEGQGIYRMMDDAESSYNNTMEPKDEIEYWKNEISTYSIFLSNNKNRLLDEDFQKSLTPKKYDELRGLMDRAIYSLAFAQQSLQKLLLVKAISPEQIETLRKESLTKFENDVQENDKKLSKLNKLKGFLDIYSCRVNISKALQDIVDSNDEENKFKLYSVLKYEFDNLKDTYLKYDNNPEISSLLDKQYEDLLNIDDKERKEFLSNFSAETKNLLQGVKNTAKSTLGFSGDFNIEQINSLFDIALQKANKEKLELKKNIEFVSQLREEEAKAFLSLNLYSSLYDTAEKTGNAIKSTYYKNYTLSPEIEKTIEENAKNYPKGITAFFKNNFSKDIKNQKRELAIAMYPFLSYENNIEKLEQYIFENNEFLNKLVYSGITPEQLIQEQENAKFLQDTKLQNLQKMSQKIYELLKQKNKKDPLSYKFMEENVQTVFRLNDNLLKNLENLPENDEGLSEKSYIKRVAENLSRVSKGLEKRKTKVEDSIEDIQIIGFDKAMQISKEQRKKDIANFKFNDEFTRVLNNTNSDKVNNHQNENNENISTLENIIENVDKKNKEVQTSIDATINEPISEEFILDTSEIEQQLSNLDNLINEIEQKTNFITNATGNNTQRNSPSQPVSNELSDIEAAINNANTSTTKQNVSSELSDIEAAINAANISTTKQNVSSKLSDIEAAINNANTSTPKQNVSSELSDIEAAINNANTSTPKQNVSSKLSDIEAAINNANTSDPKPNVSSELSDIEAAINNANTSTPKQNVSSELSDIEAAINNANASDQPTPSQTNSNLFYTEKDIQAMIRGIKQQAISDINKKINNRHSPSHDDGHDDKG